MSTIWIEECRTPIYQRIAQALAHELARNGHQLMLVKPTGFDLASFEAFVATPRAGVYLTTNESNAIQMLSRDGVRYFFELYPGPVVFVHQDSIIGRGDYATVLKKLEAYQRIKDRACHLCIEAGNVELLRSVGIEAAQLVAHATEISATEPRLDGWTEPASFVGHVLPRMPLDTQLDAALEQRLQALVEQRVQAPALRLAPELQQISSNAIGWFARRDSQQLPLAAHTLWLRGQIHQHSLIARGSLLAAAGLEALTIYGGDPAYLHGVAQSVRLALPGLHHAPPVYELSALRQIYAGSAVSLNITALQFDDALINRFHDVVMAGGLCLTDAKRGLAELTRHHEQVSYRSPAELAERVAYFADPRHARERALLIKSIQQEIAAHATYANLAQAVEHAAAGLPRLA